MDRIRVNVLPIKLCDHMERGLLHPLYFLARKESN